MEDSGGTYNVVKVSHHRLSISSEISVRRPGTDCGINKSCAKCCFLFKLIVIDLSVRSSPAAGLNYCSCDHIFPNQSTVFVHKPSHFLMV